MPRTLTNQESLRFQNSCRSLFRCPRKSGRLWSGMLLRRDQWNLSLDKPCMHSCSCFYFLFGFLTLEFRLDLFFFRNPKVGHLDYFNRLFDCFNTVCFNVFQFFEFGLKFGFGILNLRRWKPICLSFIDFHPFSFIFTHFDSLQSILQ